jgi:hypothetical protein
MQVGKRVKWSLGFILIISVVMVCLVGESSMEKRQAENLLRALSRVEVGKTTLSQARDITSGFVHHQIHQTSGTSGEDQFRYWNSFLSIVKLTPRTYVFVTLKYSNGVVVKKTMQYIEEPRCSAIISETVELIPNETDNSLGESRHVYIGGNAPSPTFIMRIDDATEVPSTRRQLDWQVDLSCMTKIGGCRDPRKVLHGALQ